MRKHLLLTIMCLFGLFTPPYAVNAQETSFFYDFNDSSLEGWNVFQESEATSPNWAIGSGSYYGGNEESPCVYSMSYEFSELIAKNYIVTAQAYTITSESVLSWYIRHTYPGLESYDNYAIVISTDGENFEHIADYTAEGGLVKELSLAEYAGQNLYVGFYHYGQGGDAICIDNITLTAGEGSETPEESVALAVPANVFATANGQNTIVVTWDAVEGAEYYIVYKDGQMFNSETGTSNTINDLTAGTQYCFNVQAFAGDYGSELSEETCATTESEEQETPEQPEQPGDLASEFFYDFNDGTMNGWRAIDADGDSYTWSVNTNSIVSYSYIAGAAGGETLYPDNFIVTTDAYQILEESVLSWYVKPADSYYYYYDQYAVVVSTDNETFNVIWEETLIAFGEFEERSINLGEYVEVGQNVVIGFRHYNCNGSTATGVFIDDIKIANSYKTDAPEIPEKPNNVVATAQGSSAISLSWYAVGVAASYNVYNGTELVANVEGTTYTVEGLNPETTYCYTVTAVKEDGEESEASAEVCATTTVTAPATPTNLVATLNGETSVSLTWDAVETAASYNIYSGTSLVANVEEAAYTVEGLEAETTYCFTVKAVNNGGESEASETCATTESEEQETPEQPEQPAGDLCTIIFTLTDSYGDGWNGNYLLVEYNDESVQLTFENGHNVTETLFIPKGAYVKVTYNASGQYQNENGFTVALENGMELLNVAQGTCTNSDATYEFHVPSTFVGIDTSLADAVEAAEAGSAIMLFADVEDKGFIIDKDITIDFGGHTYSFTEGVGSGDKTSNGLQILQGNNVVLKNGSLKVADDYKDNFYILIQNYANLTLENMNLDGTNLDKYSFTDQDSYVLSNNSGEVNIIGNTNITANNDGEKAFAFDVCKFMNYEAPVVNVNTTGTISGNIEVSEGLGDNLNITGGAFTMNVAEWCAYGYRCIANEDGIYTIETSKIGDYAIVDYDGYSLKFAITSLNPLECSVTCSTKPSSPTAVTIPATVEINGVELGVTSISADAFNSCSSLTSVEIPSSVTSIGSNAFNSCSSLEKVIFGEDSQLTEFRNGVFAHCDKLISIDIPSKVVKIDDWAFSESWNIKSIRCFANDVPKVEGFNNTNIVNIQVPEESIEEYKATSPWNQYTITKIYPYHYGEYVVEEYEGYSLRFTANPLYEGAEVRLETQPTEPTAVTIPATVEINGVELGVTSISAEAFNSCSSLTSVEIPSSVTSIGSNAFRSCSSLTSVTFGEGSQLTTINVFAFESCSNLTSIEIPSNVTSIGEYAFAQCPNLNYIRCYAENVPGPVMGVWDDYNGNMFSGVDYIKNIQVPEASIEAYKATNPWMWYNVTKIYPYFVGEEVVIDCEEGYSLKFEAMENFECSVTGCTQPTSPIAVTIPATVEINGVEVRVVSIGSSAFVDCSSLTSVEIPSSVTSIGSNAFNSCSSLEKVIFGEDSQLTEFGDRAFNDCSNLTSIELPSSVTYIGSGAFTGCSSLTSVEIPNGITEIESHTFAGCRNMEKVTIPNTVVTIGNNAFESCSSLTSVEIPNGITEIESYTFAGCRNMEKVTIPNTVVTIGNNAFRDCDAFVSIRIPSSVVNINDNAFCDCDNLIKVTIDDNSQLIGVANEAFYSCDNLKTIIFGENSKLETIGDSALGGCWELANVEIPSTVTKIGKNAFFNSNALISMIIPSGVSEIGESAFASCWNFENIIFEENSQLKSISKSLFEGTKIKNISIPEGVTSIENSAFKSCGSLVKVELPSSLVNIRNFAFQNCGSLDTVVFAENSKLEVIGDCAFKDCRTLSYIEIPSGVNYVGFETFAYCSNLTKIESYVEVVPETDGSAFDGCPENMRIGVPYNSVEAYKAASPWNNYTIVSEIVQHEITATVNLDHVAYVEGAGVYFDGETVTVKAIARESGSGYWDENGNHHWVEGNSTFAYWSEDGKFVSADAEYTFVAEADRNLVANYQRSNYWIPNPGISQYNMSVTADIQIENVPANNLNIELGAFCNGELRGSARLQYISAVDKLVYHCLWRK